jgi:hypothetical protein
MNRRDARPTIDDLMTALVQAPDDETAIRLARSFTRTQLASLADLMHMFEAPTPANVVREARA